MESVMTEPIIAFIFYDRRSWHIFNTQCLPAIIPYGADYTLRLSVESGDHIRLTLFIDEVNIETETINLTRNLNSFFKSNPSAREPESYPLNTLFKNFPNNTVYYNLNFRTGITHNTMAQQYDKEAYGYISKIILEVLSKEEFNAENIFSFAIYMQFGAIKASGVALANANQIIISLIEKFAARVSLNESAPGELDNNQFLTVLAANQSILKDIAMDVWHTPYSPELAWLQQWVDLCSKRYHIDSETVLIAKKVIDIVNELLEIDNDKALIMLKLMHDGLNS